MKIGILTYYNVHNHGAMLQAFALQKVFQNMDNDVEFLRFARNYDFISEGLEKKYKFGIPSIKFYINYFILHGMGTFLFNYRKKSDLKKFRNDNFQITNRYSDATVNAVCIGSDEVFALDVGVNPFFYGHALKVDNIFSYAGSFGATVLNDIKKLGCDKLISSGIEHMKHIGVRDKNSYEIVEDIANVKPTLVCDPVILYGYDKEISMLMKINTRYVLLYSYDKNSNSKEEIEAIKNFAKKSRCKVYSVGYYHKWCDKNINVSPIELIGYFRDATYVITDTFHGSVLSLITKAQFAARLRTNKNKLEFLLRQYNLLERIVTNYSELDVVFDKIIDYAPINIQINEHRALSIAFLSKCLGVAND